MILGDQPFFITGCMRSGTTALGHLLDHHPQLCRIGWEMTDEWQAHGGLRILPDKPWQGAPDPVMAPTWRQGMAGIFRKLVAERRPQAEAGGLGVHPLNKAPHLINKIGHVAGLFPTARFILIVRDIQSHAVSMKRHFDSFAHKRDEVYVLPRTEDIGQPPSWSFLPAARRSELEHQRCFPGNLALIAEAWARLNAGALDDLAALPPGQWTVVDFDRLIRAPKAVFAELLDHFGLPGEGADCPSDILGEKLHVRYSDGDPTRNRLSGDDAALLTQALDHLREPMERIRAALPQRPDA